jgi:hypothetical protein
MFKDERDVLSVLKSELEFLEKGSYARSAREPWRYQLFFEDSPTCMNYDSKDESKPCKECVFNAGFSARVGWREDPVQAYSSKRAGGDAGFAISLR